MEEEDFPIEKQKARNLAPMSIDELQLYIAELKNEIGRVEQEIAKKKAHLTDAASFFKKT